MNNKIDLKPVIYELHYDSEKTSYYLKEVGKKFTDIPEKVYGTALGDAKLVFDTYNKGDKSLGVMLTGDKGSGKTETVKLICNHAINAGIAVVQVVNTHTDLKLVKELSEFNNTVILLDEFGKNFSGPLQSKMLSLLEGTSSGKRLTLITENKASMINIYLKDRPGRVLFHLEFGRIDEEIIHQMCKDQNVPDWYKNEILMLFSKNSEFSIDALINLIKINKMFPDMSVGEIYRVINLKTMFAEPTYDIISCKNTKEPEREYIFTSYSRTTVGKKLFKSGLRTNIVIEAVPTEAEKKANENSKGFRGPGGDTKYMNFNKANVIEVRDNGNEYTILKDGFQIELRLAE